MYSLKRAGPLPEWLCPDQGDARRCDCSSRKGEGITDSSQNDGPGCLIMQRLLSLPETLMQEVCEKPKVCFSKTCVPRDRLQET